jgi:hypothetical protein
MRRFSKCTHVTKKTVQHTTRRTGWSNSSGKNWTERARKEVEL